MRLKALVCSASLLAGSAMMYAAGPAATHFTVSEQTQIPGLTLKPGTYSIRVVDHLSDRLIVRIENAQGNAHATFLGIQNSGIAKPSASGPVVWTKSPKDGPAIRGFEFPGNGPVVEFVYPKAEAVSIATVNDSKVPAIDPASEGKVADKSLSKNDLEVVTLWLLSSTTVGPSDAAAAKPGIQAERYQAPPSSEVASVGSGPATGDATDARGGSSPVRKAKPVIAKLPHTASAMPLIWMLGGLCLLSAALLRLIRRSGGPATGRAEAR